MSGRYRVRVIKPHADVKALRARACYREYLGAEAEAQREREIGLLPRVKWRGRIARGERLGRMPR